MKASSIVKKVIPILVLLFGFAGERTLGQSNTQTTTKPNDSGGVTVTTTTTYNDGSTKTETNYDKDGHDTGTTRTDIQTRDGETATTITKYDGAGHETGKTIERMDKDGNKTITTYDRRGHETGRTTIPKEAPKGDAPKNVQASIEGIVVPDDVHDRQPFSFAAPQVVSGAVVSIKTIDGVVVDHMATDKYGRVFLASGLPAGAYLISLANRDGQSTSVGKIEVRPGPTDAVDHSGEQPSPEMKILNPPRAVKAGDPLSISGRDFSPNFADMHADLRSSGKIDSPIVLASTQNQLKLAPSREMTPGVARLSVTNNVTRQTTEPTAILLYDVQASLERHKLTSSEQTQLVLKTQPEDFPMLLKVSVVSGPVDFGGARKEMEAITSHGQATFPVHAEKGSGPFQLTWKLETPNSSRADTHGKGPSDEEIATILQQEEAVQFKNTSLAGSPITASLRDEFLKWWGDYLEGMMAYEMLDGWITSPFSTLEEGDLRAEVRTRITALSDGAKKKLIQRLKDRAKALRDKAKNLNSQGKTDQAERALNQAKGFDQAADEVEKSLPTSVNP